MYVGSTQKALLNKDITIIKVASHMNYIDIKLVCPTTYAESKKKKIFLSVSWIKCGGYMLIFVEVRGRFNQ